MIAKTQYKLTGADLEVVLALVRGKNLATASQRLGVDASTVFRSIQRIEKGIGQRLFERTRSGYVPLELVQVLADHAEQIEMQLESARSAAQQKAGDVSGTVRITTTDTILHGLVAPSLKLLGDKYPLLSFELKTTNALVNLMQRDADIAIRATKQPPEHLIGKKIGAISLALYAGVNSSVKNVEDAMQGEASWIDPINLPPDHPSTAWRIRNLPKVMPRFHVNDFLAVRNFIELGLGVGILPKFLADGRKQLVQLTDPLKECETEAWLLTHPESRHLLRVSTVYSHFVETLKLD